MAHSVKQGREIVVKNVETGLTTVDDSFIELTKKRTRARESILTKEEFFRMMQAGRDPLDRVILALAIMGLRAGEIAAINKDWVDLANKTIRIPDSIAKKGHGRTVPYGKFTRLASLIDAFFIMSDGVNMSRVAVWRRIKALASRAGIARSVTPHGLRATGATWAASAGLSAQALKELFGWECLQTAQYYIEKSAGTAAKELEILKESIV